MSHARVLGIGLAALAAAAVAYAQTEVTAIPDADPVETAPLEQAQAAPQPPVTWGDPQNGQTLAGTCAACHGLDGNPTDPMYPRLAGQGERYIAEQIARYKANERTDGMAMIMKPFADMLSAQDARDVGAWFASQKSGAGVADDTVVAAGPYEGMRFFEIGEQLYRSGDASRGIPSCMACHGPDGTGNPGPAYPHVGGQHASYTQQRLDTFRNGTGAETDRRLFRIMADIAERLTEEEIGALSSYMQGLHPAADDLVASAAPVSPAAPVPAAADPDADPLAADTLQAQDGEAEAGLEAPAAEGAEAADPAADGTDATPDAEDAAPAADTSELG